MIFLSQNLHAMNCAASCVVLSPGHMAVFQIMDLIHLMKSCMFLHCLLHYDKHRLFYPFRGLAKIVQKQTVFALCAFCNLRKNFCPQFLAIIITNCDPDPLMLIISVISIKGIESVFFGDRFIACQGHSLPKTQTQFHLCFEFRIIF